MATKLAGLTNRSGADRISRHANATDETKMSFDFVRTILVYLLERKGPY